MSNKYKEFSKIEENKPIINKIKNKHRQSCIKKQRYNTEEFANELIKEGLERGTVLFTYFCNYCGGWHLTKKPRNIEVVEKKTKTFNKGEIRKLKKIFGDDFDKILKS